MHWNHRRRWLGITAVLAALMAVEGARAGEPLREAFDAIRLMEHHGRPFALGDVDARFVVVAFLGTECPLARLYAPRLEQIHQKYHDQGVVILGVNSNSQDSLSELAIYRRVHELTFPQLKDTEHRLADLLKAKRTPEVFVLDEQRVVRYQGRIDDQYDVGVLRPDARQHFLAEVLDQLIAGSEVTVPSTEAVGCFIGRRKEIEPQGDVTYAEHIAPILYRRCVECHRPGEVAPFSLTSYEDVLGWEETILEVIDENRMPPWNANPEFGHFRNDSRLTPEEKELIHQWVDNGMPLGDAEQLPPLPEFVTGWRMGTPDLVIPMSDTPFEIPADGVVDYQYFEVDPGFTEDMFVQAAEARPQNRSVVHHILVYIKPPGEKDFRRVGAVDGYAPGSPPTQYDGGRAMRIPAGSKLVFELHYTPNGSPQKDLSQVGLRFIDKKDVTQIVHGAAIANTEFRIPPGDAHYVVTARRKMEREVLLLNLTPHMHVRGKSFRYEATYPDGTQEVLLDVPRYDFNWQLTYELAEPKVLPAGTEIVCTAVFDNSEDNPFNPDPTREVRWGDQSWEEMMIGFFDVVILP